MTNQNEITRDTLTIAMRLVVRELETLANGSAIKRHKDALEELRTLLDGPVAPYVKPAVCTHGEPDDDAACMDCLKAWGRSPFAAPDAQLAKHQVDFSDLGLAQVLAIIRGAVQRCDEQHEYMASASSDLHNWYPHKWVLDAIGQLFSINRETERRLKAQLAERDALLRLARQFVVNGVDLGYISMPEAETPDSAHDLVPKIDAALRFTDLGAADELAAT